MWKRLLILICFFHLSFARREINSDTNDGDDIDADVSTNKTTFMTRPKDKKAEIVVEKFIETLMARLKLSWIIWKRLFRIGLTQF